MSTMAQPASRPRKTVEDYLALPDDVRAELIGGELYVTPSPRSRHQDTCLQLCRLLAEHVESEDMGRVWIAPLDVHLPSGDIVQPDLLFVRTERMEIVPDWVRGAPDLVVEVVSPGHPERDRWVKRQLYARNGVPHYWIVDPDERSIEALVLEGDTYRGEAYVTGDAVLRPKTFPGLEVPLGRVFR